MRILLVTYEFPPSRSPRALRWHYLVRELALLGHEVHVLLPDMGEKVVDFPEGRGAVRLHATFPGPIGWLIGCSRRRRKRDAGTRPSDQRQIAPNVEIGLNWRGRLLEGVKQVSGLLMFPDSRAEWTPWARKALSLLLQQSPPDVVITSHEPASTLPLGMKAQEGSFAWVADLGDPICAAYTPRRWHRRAWALEAQVCALADYVMVTNQATSNLLLQRHGLRQARCAVLPNGYDDRRLRDDGNAGDMVAFDEGRLELVYAGRLYGYRDPTPLLRAIARCPGVRLTLIAPDPPTGGAAEIAAVAGDQLRVLGSLPHEAVVGILERADILINLADHGQPVRTPAKLFEYFGIARPILHVHGEDQDDAVKELLGGLRRGWMCIDDVDVLVERLSDLQERKRQGTLHHDLVLAPIAEYAHSSLARELEGFLDTAIRLRREASDKSGHVGRAC